MLGFFVFNEFCIAILSLPRELFFEITFPQGQIKYCLPDL